MDKTVILAILKPIVMILFFLIVMIVGNIPIKSKSFKRRPLLRAFGGTFAGALFINVALLHILPESAEVMNDWLQDGRDV
jgi:zinc transporter 1/2/3